MADWVAWIGWALFVVAALVAWVLSVDVGTERRYGATCRKAADDWKRMFRESTAQQRRLQAELYRERGRLGLAAVCDEQAEHWENLLKGEANG